MIITYCSFVLLELQRNSSILPLNFLFYGSVPTLKKIPKRCIIRLLWRLSKTFHWTKTCFLIHQDPSSGGVTWLFQWALSFIDITSRLISLLFKQNNSINQYAVVTAWCSEMHQQHLKLMSHYSAQRTYSKKGQFIVSRTYTYSGYTQLSRMVRHKDLPIEM